jgi:Obg family GTPase CgtA
MFVDEIKVFARAGHGGKGAVAFHREAYVPKGGPSGGNGGRGGSVILQADHDLNNLINQFYVPRLIAEKGEGGMGKGMDGIAGKDLIVKVPCGTLVWRLPSAQTNQPKKKVKTWTWMSWKTRMSKIRFSKPAPASARSSALPAPSGRWKLI